MICLVYFQNAKILMLPGTLNGVSQEISVQSSAPAPIGSELKQILPLPDISR